MRVSCTEACTGLDVDGLWEAVVRLAMTAYSDFVEVSAVCGVEIEHSLQVTA